MPDAPLFEDEPSEVRSLGPAPDTIACMERLRVLEKNILLLLKNVGNPAFCGRQGNGCGREIYWVMHNNGKKTPYDPTGENHFSTCPNRAAFKKP